MEEQEEKTVNRIILIGNGFDLAHKKATLKEEGLKTGYSDFMDDFWKKEWEAIRTASTKIISTQKEQTYSAYEDDFIIVRKDKEIENVEELKQKVVSYKNKFLGAMVKEQRIKNWVDVEDVFYLELIKCWKIKKENLEEDFFNSAIRKLNQDFGAIKDCLENYLYDNCQVVVDDSTKEAGGYQFEPKPSIINNLEKDEGKYAKTLFLSFNYIDTEKHYNKEEYKNNFKENEKLSFGNVIHIHGRLKDKNNPMIFGYGDELAENYRDIENLNDNEFLTYIKSIRYCETDNYTNLEEFIELKDNRGNGIKFDIYIFGHSCGNCDRTLLNKLFEHPNCNKIKVFYWQKNSTANDYDAILKNISRNFELKKKDLFRSRVIKGEPLVDYEEPEELIDLMKDYVLVEVEKNFKYTLLENKKEKAISGSYYISKYQVTQKLWEDIMGESKSFQKIAKEPQWDLRGEGDNFPMYFVNWYDCLEFCNRLSEKYKLSKCYDIIGTEIKLNENANGFRLPTEAEWEFAARNYSRVDKQECKVYAGFADKDNNLFDNEEELKKYAWFDGNSNDTTHEVGTAENASELAIHDMSGNVWEWCEDIWGSSRVVRGGGWCRNAGSARVSYRGGSAPDRRNNRLGFRLASSSKSEGAGK